MTEVPTLTTDFAESKLNSRKKRREAYNVIRLLLRGMHTYQPQRALNSLCMHAVFLLNHLVLSQSKCTYVPFDTLPRCLRERDIVLLINTSSLYLAAGLPPTQKRGGERYVVDDDDLVTCGSRFSLNTSNMDRQ